MHDSLAAVTVTAFAFLTLTAGRRRKGTQSRVRPAYGARRGPQKDAHSVGESAGAGAEHLLSPETEVNRLAVCLRIMSVPHSTTMRRAGQRHDAKIMRLSPGPNTLNSLCTTRSTSYPRPAGIITFFVA
jgi:hypothetical protein